MDYTMNDWASFIKLISHDEVIVEAFGVYQHWAYYDFIAQHEDFKLIFSIGLSMN